MANVTVERVYLFVDDAADRVRELQSLIKNIDQFGSPIEQIRPGDVIQFEPGEKHWHGASPATAMTHIAIQEKHDGKVVDWMEQVSDEQYRTR